MSTPVYRLFLRQWIRGHAGESELSQAVERSLITEDEKTEIMSREQEG